MPCGVPGTSLAVAVAAIGHGVGEEVGQRSEQLVCQIFPAHAGARSSSVALKEYVDASPMEPVAYPSTTSCGGS